MKAYLLKNHIKPSELPSKLTNDAPEPKAGPNDVIVDVYASGLNFFDILQIQGKYQVQPPFPYVPGYEFAGVVSPTSPIPEGCDFVPGKTRLFGAAQGSYGEKIAADWRQVIEIPDNLGFEEASGLFITYPTSYAALVLRAELKKDEWCLVHAGAGGVGLAAVQIAKALGAKVIATASTPEKLEVCKKLGGADYAISYAEETPAAGGENEAKGKKVVKGSGAWQKKVMEITDGQGVDVIYDPVGMITPSLKCIAWNGRAIVVGFAGGDIEKVPMNLILLKNIAVTGVHWGAYVRNEPDAIPQVWMALLELIAQGRLKPAVFEKIYEGLESVPQGLKDLAERKTWGKAVVRVRPSDKKSQAKL